MPTEPKRKPSRDELDKALEDTFPSSDPPAQTNPTRSIVEDDEVLKKEKPE